jgi:hypothetical protein
MRYSTAKAITLAAVLGLLALLAPGRADAVGDITTEARPLAVTVSLLSVSPGFPDTDLIDWCAPTGILTLTAEVLAGSEDVVEGTLVLQACVAPNPDEFGLPFGRPKEDCTGGGGRWLTLTTPIDLATSEPIFTITRGVDVPVLGVRLRYLPIPGSGLKRATGIPFNLDATCFVQ